MYIGTEYDIKCVQGHYEAQDKSGNFICSGDTFEEVQDDVTSMLGVAKALSAK